METKPITVLDLAMFRGAQANAEGAFTAEEINRVGLPFMGGCAACGATVAAYNACPSRSGYLLCASECIGDEGWDSAEAADRDIFPAGDGTPHESATDDNDDKV